MTATAETTTTITTSRGTRFPALDGVRAIAAYLVIATHVGFNSGRSLDDRPVAPFLARMDFGVTLFFLLSGFLLFRPFAAAILEGRPLPALRSFWWRRALRILPAYWLAVTVVLAVLSRRHASGADWASYLTLTQTYDGHDIDPSLTQMWTLAVEVAFYAVVPLLGQAGRRLGRGDRVRGLHLLIGLLIVATLVANLITHRADGSLSPALLWLPNYLDWFALGMLLAVASLAPSNRIAACLRGWAAQPGTCWIIGALLWWISTLPLAGPRNLAGLSEWEWTIRHNLYGASAFFLLLPLTLGSGGGLGRALGTGLARRLGEVSYGVYLWHLALLLFIQRTMHWPTFQGHFVELYLLTAVAATVVAAVSWNFFERPLLRFSQPWRRRKTARGGGEQGEQNEELDTRAAGENVG